jgi:RNA 3'-terminal phosphate cyclase (ATP)
MRLIDGSIGEGGGQILRTSLTIAAATGTPFRMTRIRAGRPRPGLRRQHLAAVRAAAAVCDARVRGLALHSQELEFRPGPVRAGEWSFRVGSAGSACLVLQTVLLPLLTASGPSRVVVEGGTHNPGAPPFEFLDLAYLPLLRRMGARVRANLRRVGFAPGGGGTIEVHVDAVSALGPLDLTERGKVRDCRGRALLSLLHERIGQRELTVVGRELGWAAERLHVERVTADGPGNALVLEVHSQHVSEVFTAFGQRGMPAETVALEAVQAVRDYLRSGAPIGPYLADQLLVPLALGPGGRFRTVAPTRHLMTNSAVLRLLLDIDIGMRELGTALEVRVPPSSRGR